MARMAVMAGNGWKFIKIAGMAGKGLKCMNMAENC